APVCPRRMRSRPSRSSVPGATARSVSRNKGASVESGTGSSFADSTIESGHTVRERGRRRAERHGMDWNGDGCAQRHAHPACARDAQKGRAKGPRNRNASEGWGPVPLAMAQRNGRTVGISAISVARRRVPFEDAGSDLFHLKVTVSFHLVISQAQWTEVVGIGAAPGAVREPGPSVVQLALTRRRAAARAYAGVVTSSDVIGQCRGGAISRMPEVE